MKESRVVVLSESAKARRELFVLRFQSTGSCDAHEVNYGLLNLTELSVARLSPRAAFRNPPVLPTTRLQFLRDFVAFQLVKMPLSAMNMRFRKIVKRELLLLISFEKVNFF